MFLKEYLICQDVDLNHGYIYPFLHIKKLNFVKLFWKLKIPFYSYIKNDSDEIRDFKTYDEALNYVRQKTLNKF